MAFYEADGVQFTVNVTGDSVPTLAWAQALARNTGGNGSAILGTVVITGNSLDVLFAPFALATGVWEIQVRAGATQGTAKTVQSMHHQVLDSIEPPA